MFGHYLCRTLALSRFTEVALNGWEPFGASEVSNAIQEGQRGSRCGPSYFRADIETDIDDGVVCDAESPASKTTYSAS